MEMAKQTLKPGVSLFHEPTDAQLAHVLNVFSTYYICTGKILCCCSAELQLGQSWETDENLQLSAPTEAQLILSSILMKWTVAHLHPQTY